MTFLTGRDGTLDGGRAKESEQPTGSSQLLSLSALAKLLAAGALTLGAGSSLAFMRAATGLRLGPGALGDLASVMALAQLGALVGGTSLGLRALATVPVLSGDLKKRQASRLANTSIALSAALALPMLGVATVILGWRLGLVTALALIAVSLQNYCRDLLRAFGRSLTSYLPISVGPFLVGVLVLLVPQGVKGSSEQMLFLVLAAGFGLPLCVIVMILRSWLGSAFLGRLGESRPSFATSDIVNYAVVVALAQTAINRGDVLLLRTFGMREASGQLAAAETLAEMGLLGVAAVVAIYAPRLTSARSPVEQRRVLRDARIISGATSLVVLGVVVISGSAIATALGDDFESTERLVYILAAGALATSFAGPVAFLGIGVGEGRTVAQVLATAAVVNVLLDLIVIYRGSVLGLALSSSATKLAMNLALLRLCKRHWLPSDNQRVGPPTTSNQQPGQNPSTAERS